MRDIISVLRNYDRVNRIISHGLRTVGQPKKKTSNKSKLKKSKGFKTNSNYKSTKPQKSKSVSQFRNKSNI